jgi:hypothetical protein
MLSPKCVLFEFVGVYSEFTKVIEKSKTGIKS